MAAATYWHPVRAVRLSPIVFPSRTRRLASAIGKPASAIRRQTGYCIQQGSRLRIAVATLCQFFATIPTAKALGHNYQIVIILPRQSRLLRADGQCLNLGVVPVAS